METKNWRLLSDPPQSAVLNMAMDEAIAIAFSEQKSPPTLRFYQWEQPSFSIGAFQKLEPDWIAFLENNKIPLVRRITGGRGLLHDRELTYSVVASTRDPLFASGIKGTFHAIAIGLITGLNQLGLEAKLHTPRRKGRTGGERDRLCFSSASWYEITVQEKKFIGSAQRRWPTYFLQHGSMNLQKSRIGSAHELPGMGPFVSKNQIALSDILPNSLSFETLVKGLKKGFEEGLCIQFAPGRLSDYERQIAEKLIQEKYGSDQWNRKR